MNTEFLLATGMLSSASASAKFGKLIVSAAWLFKLVCGDKDGFFLLATKLPDLACWKGLGSRRCSLRSSGEALPSFCTISAMRESRDGLCRRVFARRSGGASEGGSPSPGSSSSNVPCLEY